eukprot:6196138-Pleurochrysis_carterae.AAC.3
MGSSSIASAAVSVAPPFKPVRVAFLLASAVCRYLAESVHAPSVGDATSARKEPNVETEEVQARAVEKCEWTASDGPPQ